MLIICGRIIDAGADYLTLTQQVGDGQSNSLLPVWDKAVPHDQITPVRLGGYMGYVEDKIRIGHRYREGLTDWLLSATGGSSGKVISLLAKTLLPDVNCTRLDLQVTIELDAPMAELAKRYYETMKADKSYRNGMVGRRSITYYDSLTGSTLYIGARSSKGFMVRIYDKSLAFDRPLGSVWRFEVEYKKLLAKGILRRVMADKSGTLAGEIVSGCLESKCGVLLPLVSSMGGDFSCGEGGYVDRDKETLAWLEKCVRPVVVKLVDAGKTNDVLLSLGLDWVTEPNQVALAMANEVARMSVMSRKNAD